MKLQGAPLLDLVCELAQRLHYMGQDDLVNNLNAILLQNGEDPHEVWRRILSGIPLPPVLSILKP